MKLTKLLIIDAQVDFCSPSGSLCVPGADIDVQNIANLINALSNKISQIYVSLDSHQYHSIFFPEWFVDKDGHVPAPFTKISAKDFLNKRWTCTDIANYRCTVEYLNTLESENKHLTIWPHHCIIGEHGRSIMDPIGKSLTKFVNGNFGDVYYINKGKNQYTEQFSIFNAEMPLLNDPTTQLNVEVVNSLEEADLILITGEAGSHCVASSIEDLINNFKNPKSIKKLVWVENCISPVAGFEKQQKQFISRMVKRGMKVKRFEDGKLK